MSFRARGPAKPCRLVSFMKYDLGFFDQELATVTSAENPFGAKTLPMCPERTLILLVVREGLEPSTSAL